ncbi:uncharacterized protein LOC132203306 [Neocloeon triangulifer]|uniref:uncharacterized protein LOC132203306 n=1 Tax=Neocloeon triangulifer TaxID=2078957 RepID=UPI00286F0B99|nr:uncharacterized protein LOC132203306 [Neocloeon triangulifer]
MQPFALESKEKLECMKLQALSWKFNLNYWTGGTKNLASGAFGWCSAKDLTPWQDVLPLSNLAKDQNCVQMQISKLNGSISISGSRCSDSMVFACQGPPTIGPKCFKPLCPNITCQKDPKFFTTPTNGTSMILKNISLHGRLYTNNLRFYLISYQNDTRTYVEAMKACCDVGMSLLSLDGQYKYNALANISSVADFLKEPENLTFWTSGSDEGCESIFGYCSAERLFRDEAKWLPGQPDNAGGNENFVAVNIYRNKSQVLLADYDGQTKFRYICEKRGNPQSKNDKQAIIDECSIIYGVTQSQIDLLYNQTTLSLQMKCFVRCVGDSVGLLVGGKFVASAVFAMLELMAMQNTDALMNSTAIVDGCNSNASGMDECDQAYQTAKCARDKAPAIFDNIVTNMNNQTTDVINQIGHNIYIF